MDPFKFEGTLSLGFKFPLVLELKFPAFYGAKLMIDDANREGSGTEEHCSPFFLTSNNIEKFRI